MKLKTKDYVQVSTLRQIAEKADIILLVGVRSGGKSFAVRQLCIEDAYKNGKIRAIGVSKKNLKFKFIVDSLTLATLTVLVGYVLSSVFIATCVGISPLMSSVFFYPWWYALILLGELYLMSLICGILPMLGILRKTPSEILAKYDI